MQKLFMNARDLWTNHNSGFNWLPWQQGRYWVFWQNWAPEQVIRLLPWQPHRFEKNNFLLSLFPLSPPSLAPRLPPPLSLLAYPPLPRSSSTPPPNLASHLTLTPCLSLPLAHPPHIDPSLAQPRIELGPPALEVVFLPLRYRTLDAGGNSNLYTCTCLHRESRSGTTFKVV